MKFPSRPIKSIITGTRDTRRQGVNGFPRTVGLLSLHYKCKRYKVNVFKHSKGVRFISYSRSFVLLFNLNNTLGEVHDTASLIETLFHMQMNNYFRIPDGKR